MYEKTLLDNGVYKIETFALDYLNDIICFYEEKDGTITDDGYLFNELESKPLFMTENVDYVSKLVSECYKIAERYGATFTDDFEFVIKCDDEAKAVTRLLQVATLVTNLD